MAANKDLSRFVREALAAGRNRDEIAAALAGAGWSGAEVRDAMAAWSEAAFVPPIPRPQQMVTARDFFVYALTFGLLIFGASYLVLLIHAMIDQYFATTETYRPIRRIRLAMSVLVVTAPLYLWLTLRERAKLTADPSLHRSAIRKWLTYITLLIAAAILLGDLVAVIYALLNGDLTVEFLLKAATIGVVAGTVFTYYLIDIRRGDQV